MKKALYTLLPCIAVVVILWLPYGFQMGGLIEEWGLLGLYSQHGPFFFAGADSLMPLHQMRPLMTTPWGIAYAVDADSWWFWHLELALSLVIKGASVAWMAHYLTGSRRLAMVAGLIMMVWPADTMQMAFRAMNVGISCAFILLSAALLIAAYQAERRKRQRALSILSATFIVFGTWMYELTLLLAPLPFLIMYARSGLSGASEERRGKGGVTVAWILGCAISVAYIGNVLLTAKDTYQQEVVGGKTQLIAAIEANVGMLFSRGFFRSLVGGWLDAGRIVTHDLPSPVYLVAMAVIFAAMIAATPEKNVDPAFKSIGRIALAGAIALAVGFAPFLVSLSHLGTTQRTYMFATPGAVLIFLALLCVVDRLHYAITATAAVILLVLGCTQQLYQFDVYRKIYESQREVLRSIVQQLKDPNPVKTVIILDDSQRLNGIWMLDQLVPSALTYLTGKPVPAALVCATPQNIWETRDAMSREGTCVETADSWVFKGPTPISGPGVPLTTQSPDFVVSKSNAEVVHVPRDLVDDKSLLTGHAAVLNPDTWPFAFRMFGRTGAEASHHWDFGHRWDLPDVYAGAGWRPEEWRYTPLRQTSVAWIDQPRATLIFDLTPSANDYVLSIQTLAHAPAAMGNVQISVNGVDVPVQWANDHDLSASLKRGILKKGSNIIEFKSPPSTDYYGLSLYVDQIDLAPSH